MRTSRQKQIKQPFQIVLLANYPGDHSVSMNSFASCLEREYRARSLQVLVAQPAVKLSRLVPPGMSKWFGYIDKLVLARKSFRKMFQALSPGAVVHVLDQASGIYLDLLRDKPHLLTCNDLLAIRSAQGEIPEHKTRWTGRLLQNRILSGLRHARRVACISEVTRNDFIRLTGAPQQTVSVNYMGLNYPYKNNRAGKDTRTATFKDAGYILHVGGTQWYKNRSFVIEGFNLIKLENPHLNLVLAGQPLSKSEQDLINRWQLSERVIVRENCTNSDLEALYSAAFCLMFPSLYEGFGWPILEAQSCGCPVVTSNRAPMTEIGDGSVVYINPQDPRSLLPAIKKLSVDSLRTEIITAGLSNALRFTTERMVAEYLRLYETVLTSSSNNS